MDDLVAARQLQALSLGWHIIIVCFAIAFPVMTMFEEWRWLRTGLAVHRTIAMRWSRAMAVLFAVGAVSGTILSFEFGILWPDFMARYGDVFGLAFALEGFAFFIEAIFIAIYLYGWGRLSPRVHFLTGVPVAVGGTASAFFVIAVNGWMNAPVGFSTDAAGRVEDVDPWAVLSANSFFWHEFVHMMLAGVMVAGFLTATVYAWGFARGRSTDYHRRAFTVAFSFAAVAAPVQLIVGDWAARYVAEHQPVKLAAMEGLTETTTGASLTVGGVYVDGELRYGLRIPRGLSLLATHDPDSTIEGLETVAVDDRPPITVVHLAFDLMVLVGTALAMLSAWWGISWWRRRAMPASRVFRAAALVAGPAAVLAMLAGWTVTEVGRQPWIVYDQMRTADAVTAAGGVVVLYLALVGVYCALTAGAVVVLSRLARRPLEEEPA